MMKRITVLILCFIFVFSLVACSSKPAEKSEEPSASKPTEVVSEASEAPKKKYDLKWGMGPVAENPYAVATEGIIKEIYEKSDGRIKITLYPAAQLGPDADMLDMTSVGTLDFYSTSFTLLGTKYDPCQALTLPYVFKDTTQAYKFLNSQDGKDLADKITKATNIRPLGYRSMGFRQLTTKGVAVQKPEDLSGIKIRSMESTASQFMVRCLGGTPLPVSFSELYIALQTGVASGQENPIANIVASKFYEVQDYLILTNHLLWVSVDTVSETLWKSFSEEDKQIISNAISKYTPISDQACIDAEQVSIAMMKEKGVTVIEPDVEAFRTKALQMIKDEYSDKAEWMDIVNKIEAMK